MKSLFKNDDARTKILEWYERFHARLQVPTERRIVQTGFGETHVLVGGPEHGQSLVILHGALASSAHLMVELAPLLEHFRVYAVDIPGQSVKSADVRLSVKNNDHGLWLSEVMDRLELASARVLGVSWGGYVALRLAAAAPQRIERLALLVPAGMVKSPGWSGFVRIGWPMTRYIMKPTPERLERFAANLLTTTDDDWKPYIGDAFLSYNLGFQIPKLATPEELVGYTGPVLVVGADKDFSFPGARVLARAPELFQGKCQVELLTDCNHSPPTTDTFREWMSARLVEFFK